MVTKQYSKDIRNNPVKNRKFTWVVSVLLNPGQTYMLFKTKEEAVNGAKEYMKKYTYKY